MTHKKYSANYTRNDYERMIRRKLELNKWGGANWKDVEREVYGYNQLLQENSDSQFIRNWLSEQDEKHILMQIERMNYARSQKTGIDDLIIG